MNFLTNNLSSNADQRRVLISPSSSSALGFKIDDIVNLNDPSQVRSGQASISPPSLEERVFTALANAKIWTSRVAMHMDLAARDRYFRQLDRLHDCDEWFGNDQPMQLESYKSFILFMLMIDGGSKPSLALASNGHLLAVWETRGDRLTVEFKADGGVEWVVSRHEGDRIERAAGTTTLARLKANLAPYHPEAWFILG